MTKLRALVHRLLRRTVLAGDGVCPPYLITYRLAQTRWGGLYVHHFLADDWSRDLHDHPYPLLSVGLRGGYDEELPEGKVKAWTAPWLRLIRPTDAHRIRLRDGHDCWTLVLSLRGNRKWGFYTTQGWIAASQYMAGTPRRSC